ncbi:Sodium/hydrogen exchanger family-domain-containing protein [Pterulicium gracile]|uniref:Sodium/hydrogen exchanger family-domain-containing protein n=1 Tax=Pterulicium gracile TaxID=1884261 RepID=A0A5C3QM75_9AGAR|nr:Sodium/hydrogen exchanger family-domain-containing protein [Pterula gracilis]
MAFYPVKLPSSSFAYLKKLISEYQFEVTVPHLIYALLGGFVVLFGMFSLLLRERLYVGEACWAFLFGIAMGPFGANIFNPRGWGDHSDETTNVITLEFTRVVLAIGVFAIGVELPKAYMARHWKSIFYLLVPVMTFGWFVCAGLIYALVPALNFRSALVIAACLTPTDPILAAAVVGGKYADKHVPAHIRHLLAAESGCNDGAAFPFLFLALYLIIDDPNVGSAVKDWFLILWLYQIILGTAIGAGVGFGFRHLMKFCEQKNLIDRHSYIAQYISLAIFTVGITVLLGSDDLLATFACGAAFAWDGFFNRQTEESNFSSVIDLLFNIATFIYLGAWIPFDHYDDPALTLTVWRLVLIALLILLLRRLPIMIALYKWIPDIKTFREAVFCGHFGPMGVGAVFISTLAAEFLHKRAGENATEQTHILEESLQPIVSFMVLVSIIIHGLSIPSFSLGRRVHSISRTWSRHAPQPDWADSTKVVGRGDANIVINRDEADLEKGEYSPEGASVMRDEEKLGESSMSSKEREEAMKEEVPADGMEILAEWQEGPHTVIERRAGPGEEVGSSCCPWRRT